MARIAVIGAGQAGTLAARGLQNLGHEVSLYSDRTADEIFEKTPPTGTAYVFGRSVAVERRLGVDTYEDRAVSGDSIHLFFNPKIGTELIDIWGLLGDAAGYAVDVRLKSYDRMGPFVDAGGELVIGAVTPEELDRIAADHDLTFVATGKGALADLFERDAERSIYDSPQRYLGMLVARGVPTDGTAFPHRIPGHTPVAFNFFGDAGEFFWVPFLHKSGEQCWNLVLEARPGGPFDTFRDASSAEDMAAAVRRIVADYAPWDRRTLADMEPIGEDPYCWLRGQFPPTVRRPVGRTASGHPVMALGDTAYAFDPIGGQGAGCGIRQVGWYLDAVAERPDGPFDPEWMEQVAEGFWSYHAGPTWRFNSVLLEPLDKVGVRVMQANYGSQACSEAFFRNFDNPADYFPWLVEREAADRWIAETSGEPAGRVVRRGILGVVKGRLRQTFKKRNFVYDDAV